jgi:hypothetical protein
VYEVFEVSTGIVFATTEFEFQAFIVAKRMGYRYDYDRKSYDVWPTND